MSEDDTPVLSVKERMALFNKKAENNNMSARKTSLSTKSVQSPEISEPICITSSTFNSPTTDGKSKESKQRSSISDRIAMLNAAKTPLPSPCTNDSIQSDSSTPADTNVSENGGQDKGSSIAERIATLSASKNPVVGTLPLPTPPRVANRLAVSPNIMGLSFGLSPRPTPMPSEDSEASGTPTEDPDKLKSSKDLLHLNLDRPIVKNNRRPPSKPSKPLEGVQADEKTNEPLKASEDGI